MTDPRPEDLGDRASAGAFQANDEAVAPIFIISPPPKMPLVLIHHDGQPRFVTSAGEVLTLEEVERLVNRLKDEVIDYQTALRRATVAAGYESCFLAKPSGNPMLMCERRHPTKPGMIQSIPLEALVEKKP